MHFGKLTFFLMDIYLPRFGIVTAIYRLMPYCHFSRMVVILEFMLHDMIVRDVSSTQWKTVPICVCFCLYIYTSMLHLNIPWYISTLLLFAFICLIFTSEIVFIFAKYRCILFIHRCFIGFFISVSIQHTDIHTVLSCLAVVLLQFYHKFVID